VDLTAIDYAALTRAMTLARGESAARFAQIDAMAASGPWEEVAKFASYCCQTSALNLMPWQNPPMYTSLVDLDKPFGDTRGSRESAELLKRLLDAGLSKFEPDPLRALELAEAKARP
jgi:hypothetical protein